MWALYWEELSWYRHQFKLTRERRGLILRGQAEAAWSQDELKPKMRKVSGVPRPCAALNPYPFMLSSFFVSLDAFYLSIVDRAGSSLLCTSFLYLWWARATLLRCVGFWLLWLLLLRSMGSWAWGLLTAVASLIAEHGLLGMGASVVAAFGLSSWGTWA